MKIVIDSNILFSACIAPFGDNADLLLNPKYTFEKFSCHYLIVEMFKHQEKIVRLSKQPLDNVIDVLYSYMRKITFVSEELISQENWIQADELTKEIDNKDIAFAALTLHITNSVLWTNDMKLINGLQKIGFDRVITTKKLLQKYKDFNMHV
jgi:predicted nucleic acid-binding protein